MVCTNSNIREIILNVNGLNTPIKYQDCQNG